MEQKTLILELYQPFAQYRNPFTFYYAQTYPLPPISTISGLFQRVLAREWGWDSKGVYYFPRDEDTAERAGVEWERARKFWDLKVSIHGAFSGVFWNYQQLIKATKIEPALVEGGVDLLVTNENNPVKNYPLPLYTGKLRAQRSPVKQQELFNGYLVILVRGDEEILKDLKRGLHENPKFVLRLGRSEDIVFVLRAELDEPKKMYERKYYRSLLGTYLRREALNMSYAPYYLPVVHRFVNDGEQVLGMWGLVDGVEREVVFDTLAYVPAGSLVKMKESHVIEVFELKSVPKVEKRERDNEKPNILLVPEVGWHGVVGEG